LAYFINQKLSINLSKSKNEIQINIKEGETNFSRFCYSNSDKEISWDLIQNKTSNSIQKKGYSNLFSNLTMEVATKCIYFPNLKSRLFSKI
jgi:hypothetical protein